MQAIVATLDEATHWLQLNAANASERPHLEKMAQALGSIALLELDGSRLTVALAAAQPEPEPEPEPDGGNP